MITLPVIAVVTPVASLVTGNLLLGESARLGVLGGAAAALAVLVTSAGLVVLARLTTGQPGPVGRAMDFRYLVFFSGVRLDGQVPDSGGAPAERRSPARGRWRPSRRARPSLRYWRPSLCSAVQRRCARSPPVPRPTSRLRVSST